MKSILKRTLALAAAMLWVVPVLVFASDQVQSSPQAQTTTIKFKLNDYSYNINGKKVDMDVPTLMISDRICIPVRYLANGLGIKDDHILYDEETRHVKLLGTKTIELTLDDNHAIVDGQQISLDVGPVSRLTRAYLPARFISEELGWKVYWDDHTSTVIITKKVAVDAGAPKPKQSNPINVTKTKYYELQNTVLESGIFREQLLFETPIGILLNYTPYDAIILKNGSKTVYLEKNNGVRFKYQLSSPIIQKDGRWLVSDDQDVTLLSKLGNFLKTK